MTKAALEIKPLSYSFQSNAAKKNALRGGGVAQRVGGMEDIP
jgi:hypothetical protein